MCSPHCPCLITGDEEEVTEDTPPSDLAIMTHMAQIRYGQVNEIYLNMRHRTWNETTKGDTKYVPLYWTSDKNRGVTTFSQCLEQHF